MSKLRIDAAQNRADILAAAEIVFAEHGVNAPLDLVRQQADVGRATLYRNFPDRHALLVALLDRAVERTAEHIGGLGEDPNALFSILRFIAETLCTNTALSDYWRAAYPEMPETVRAREWLFDLVRPHLERAIKADVCRSDLTIEDVSLQTSMLGAALRGRTPEERARLAARALSFLIDGLRARPELS
ncbi:TetR/AcrR family transcriptional regulator [Aureimonas sp. AU20]|uniref:TetR/AcrR family transcriptional regulator n=1 Tax=Aureimonas sp. AU20 TaxID=1349819 RepID=UPI00071F9051|nr:TetR/AcrR family transcriptional regulator [Aureimonas sp. AU20]ALN75045.1 hypothetical protein M673_20155 [Aureimonas sp. AU20]